MNHMPKPRYYIPYAILSLFIASCTAHTPQIHTNLHKQDKVWERFDGRLLIIEPTRRWQVLIHWQANLQKGHTRLTHAATSRIIELKWNHQQTYIRDNQDVNAQWREIDSISLMKHGIVVAPQTLSKILHHQIPTSLQHKGDNVWQGKLHGNNIRLQWQNDMHKLTITDMTHGRTAILRIQS